MIFDRAIRKIKNEGVVQTVLTLDNPAGWLTGSIGGSLQSRSMKLSAVNACVEIISNSMGKLPVFVMDKETKKRIDHPLIRLLELRPNEAMTPFAYKKLVECQRLMHGNAYSAILRDRNAMPVELIPLPPQHTKPHIDDGGKLWFVFTNPKTGEIRKLPKEDVIHVLAYSEDGINGISVLKRAADVIATGQAAQSYEQKIYTQNATPPGILKVSSTLDSDAKKKVREEWHKIHSGVDNSFKVAVLDLGMEYQAIGKMNNKDTQFVESKAVSVEDISRFFNMPIYKLNAGKQSYSSNEQNSIEYVVNTLHPNCCQYEQEYTFKGLFLRDIAMGLEVKINLMAELKGDFATRGKWYTDMRDSGAFSVNDILSLEDMPDVEGGNVRLASLNYVPLEDFKDLSKNRNK